MKYPAVYATSIYGYITYGNNGLLPPLVSFSGAAHHKRRPHHNFVNKKTIEHDWSNYEEERREKFKKNIHGIFIPQEINHKIADTIMAVVGPLIEEQRSKDTQSKNREEDILILLIS